MMHIMLAVEQNLAIARLGRRGRSKKKVPHNNAHRYRRTDFRLFLKKKSISNILVGCDCDHSLVNHLLLISPKQTKYVIIIWTEANPGDIHGA